VQFQKSSGLWVATPAGSTAAIRSAGGAVLPLDPPRLQFRVRELIPGSTDGLPVLGAVIDETLSITTHVLESQLVLDGGHRRLALGLGDVVAVRLSARPLRWVPRPDVDRWRQALAGPGGPPA
jgi:NAD+ kinase